MGTSSVRVLGREYKVTRKRSAKAYGQCFNDKGSINVDPRQDAFSLRDTLLHEIMHAILWQQNQHRPYKLEESFVRPLATGIIAVLQDNPQLAAWLIAPIKEA